MVNGFIRITGIRAVASGGWGTGGILGVLLATGLVVGATAQDTQQTGGRRDCRTRWQRSAR